MKNSIFAIPAAANAMPVPGSSVPNYEALLPGRRLYLPPLC
jgi:hypothetical protein